jgi:hypothetical protein
MKSQIGKLKYVFIALLAIGCGLISGWQYLYQIPAKKCDAAGGWFSYRYRQCAQPIALPTLTGRKAGEAPVIDYHDAKPAS